MVKTYRRSLAPLLVPMTVEQRLFVDVGDGWTISGQADGVIASDPFQTIRDLKTGTRRRANAVQYGAYAVIWRSHNHDVQRLIEDYLARVKLDALQPPPLEIEIPIVEAAQAAWEAIERIKAWTAEFHRRLANSSGRAPHTAFPANPASNLCSSRFCPAWGTDFCRLHAK